MERYFIILGTEKLAFRYSYTKAELVIGGFSRNRIDMKTIIEKYIDCEMPEPKFIQTNKVRFSMRVPSKVFDDAVELLRKNNYQLIPTKTHGVLMR